MALSSLDLSSAGAAHTDPGPIGGSTPGPSGASEARSKPGAREGSMGGSLGREGGSIWPPEKKNFILKKLHF